jgi:hypothetical protein
MSPSTSAAPSAQVVSWPALAPIDRRCVTLTGPHAEADRTPDSVLRQYRDDPKPPRQPHRLSTTSSHTRQTNATHPPRARDGRTQQKRTNSPRPRDRLSSNPWYKPSTPSTTSSCLPPLQARRAAKKNARSLSPRCSRPPPWAPKDAGPDPDRTRRPRRETHDSGAIYI